MALRLLVVMAILQLASSAPDPDPGNNININVKIVVNEGPCDTKVCTYNGQHGVCSKEPKAPFIVDVGAQECEDECKCFIEGCVFDDKIYHIGGTIQDTCMELQCIEGGVWNYTGRIDPKCCVFDDNIYHIGGTIQDKCMELQCIEGGVWNYTGHIDPKCAECQAYGDPHMFTYDVHTSQDPAHYYLFKTAGIFLVTQVGLDIPADYGLSASMDLCWCSETCVRGINYFEPGLEINITLPTFNYTNEPLYDRGTSHCYSDPPSDDPECAIKVSVNGADHTLGNSMESFPANDGTVLLFKHNHYGIGDGSHTWKDSDTICINIVGSNGLSMSLCMSQKYYYSNLYVWAPPTLRGELYGLCDTYTNTTRDGYTMQNGLLTYDTELFGSTWKTWENEHSDKLPSLDKCINATVLAEIEAKCDEITEGVCEIVPTWQCAGFKVACVYDLCRSPDYNLQALAYANHFRIQIHLAQ